MTGPSIKDRSCQRTHRSRGYLARKFESEGKKKRMQVQLYQEISNNYHNLVVRISAVTSVAGIRDGAPFRFHEKLDINFDVWNFYNDEKRREMLFDLREVGAISRIYDKFNKVVNDGKRESGRSVSNAYCRRFAFFSAATRNGRKNIY